MHCRSNFTFLEGASHADELVGRAAELGHQAIAITDRNSLAGVVRAHVAAKDVGLKLLIGAEILPVDAPPAVLLPTDRAAYGRLSQLITRGRRAAPKGECRLTLRDVAEFADGLIACVPLASLTVADSELLTSYVDIFRDRCFGLAELHLSADDPQRLDRMQELANVAGVPIAAANDVHYHIPGRRFLQDVLVGIREGCPVSELGDRLFPNGERYLKSPAQMSHLFAQLPDAVERTAEIADRCRFSLDELRYEYPRELCPVDTTPMRFLHDLAWHGAGQRYPRGIPAKITRLLQHELTLIEELHCEAYFLTVWDLVRFARGRRILCQGRGSAANSAVCYCLGVTSVDPDHIDLLFERFMSKERDEAPDIDIDFEHERREEVLQYIYDKYGRDRAGMTAEVISYRPRSAVRDVGKALGLSLDRVEVLAKSMSHRTDESLAERVHEAGLEPTARTTRQLIELVRQILGFPRHLSQHVGGMVLTDRPLTEFVPIENAAMEGRTVVQWDKNDLDALGILKVDCLSLGMLTAIRKCFDMIQRHGGRKLSLANIPPEDPAVYDMVGKADTVGVFQIESRAQMSMLPRLRPRCFYDLVIEVAIVRPGPIQGDMVHPYLRRRCGEEAVEFPNEEVRGVLEKTLGVPIFQEQAMRLAVVAAGFTPGEADQLRRAMGAWRKSGVIEKFQTKLVDGMLAKGYAPDFAERVFNQIRGFGEYGFPESHAASFALLVYVSAWLKRHFPVAFTASLLNSQPMGFYAPAQLVSDLKRHRGQVLPVDVNHSDWDCTLESNNIGPSRDQRNPPNDASELFALRLGFRMVRGLSRAHVDRLIADRTDRGLFQSFDEFARRSGFSNAVLTQLSKADVFRSLGTRRREAQWNSLPSREALPLLDTQPDPEPSADLPKLTPMDQVTADYRSTGLSLSGHPLQFVRPMLDQLRIVPSARLATLEVDRSYKVAGVVLLRQRPSTAKGITFVTIEDETGQANLIIRQDVWEHFRKIAQHATAFVARGILQRENEVIHLRVDRLEDLSDLLRDVGPKSRDFR
ncbi:MAG: error-prone DNA polymerase [Planctomycetota bacterium]|nr:error-prone DNA polymerase [Planctomycetota bacterium]